MKSESPIRLCDHPGFTPDYDVEQLAKVARCINPNSKFLEVGTLLGRSARAWYYNSDPTVDITLVDNFIFDYEDHEIEGLLFGKKELIRTSVEMSKQQKTLFGAFQELCRDFLPNVTPIEIYCATSLDTKQRYDFVFLDAAHSFDVLTALIKKFITDDNIVGGHDYNHDGHPNVVRQCDTARTMFSRDLIVINNTSLWFLVPPGSDLVDRFSKEQIEFELRS